MRRVGAILPENESNAQNILIQEAGAEANNWDGVTIQAMRRALRMRGVTDVNRLTREECIRALENQGGPSNESTQNI